MGFLSKIGDFVGKAADTISKPLGIVSGVADIAGGILGYKRDKRNDAYTRNAFENSISTRISDAERAGLSRYAALQGSAQMPSFTSSGLSLSDVGEGIGKFQRVAEDAGSAEQAKQVQSLEIRSMELDNRNKELQNAQLEKELKSVSSSPYYGVSPFPSLQGVNTALMEGQGSGNVVSTSEILGNSNDRFAFDRALDNAIKNFSLVPLANGGVSVVPAKDLMDWFSENLVDNFAFKKDLYQNAEYYAGHIANKIGAPYFWVSYENGVPQFHFSKNESEYMSWLNKDKNLIHYIMSGDYLRDTKMHSRDFGKYLSDKLNFGKYKENFKRSFE